MFNKSTKDYLQLSQSLKYSKQEQDSLPQQQSITNCTNNQQIQCFQKKQHESNGFTSQESLKNKLKIRVFCLLVVLIFFLIGISIFKKRQKQNEIIKKAWLNINEKKVFSTNTQITSVFLINNKEYIATKSLISYLNSIFKYFQNKKSRLKFADILVGYRKKFTKKNLLRINKVINSINQIISEPIQVRWVQRKNQQSELKFIDNLFKLVATQYFFFSSTSYIYFSGNQIEDLNSIQYIELSLQILASYPYTSQLILRSDTLTPNKNNNGKRSFSFSPSLHRIQDYILLGKNFIDISGYSSTLIEAQKKISEQFMLRNQYAIQTYINFGITYNNKDQLIEQQFSGQTQSSTISQISYATNLISSSQTYFNQNFKSVSYQLQKIQKKLTKPQQYFQFEKLKQVKQLPICVVAVPSKKYPFAFLLRSIKNQNYENYIIIEAPSLQSEGSDNPSNQIHSNYYYYKKQIKNQCKSNSLVVFVRSPLLPFGLVYINKIHQTNWAYVSYSKSQQIVQIHSFFYRIYQLMDKIDFDKKNSQFLKKNNIQIQTLAFLEISSYFIIQIQKNKIMSNEDIAYFHIQRNSTNRYNRSKYISIYRLSHDIEAAVYLYNDSHPNYTQFLRNNVRRAVLRQQIWYLPQNHTIQQLQQIQLNQMFNISKYKNKSRQVRFCLTVLSHNNIQHDRYKKVLKSILGQKYDNYHIVFIDDNSDDNTMNATKQYLRKMKFPKNRIRYVQNLQRLYASYNIINAGFNFCNEDDIQMLMDGDDELIGKYAFQVMNSAYQLEDKQNKQVWVAYSSYKNNSYFIGRSKALDENLTYDKRPIISLFGPIRTWRVKVIYNIPPINHKQQNGKWLNTVYDEALFYPLSQISSVKRIRYMPSILYEYNQGYGDNDNSNQEKLKNRLVSFLYIKSLPRLTTIQTLQGSIKNQDLVNQFNKDQNVKYKTIDIQ